MGAGNQERRLTLCVPGGRYPAHTGGRRRGSVTHHANKNQVAHKQTCAHPQHTHTYTRTRTHKHTEPYTQSWGRTHLLPKRRPPSFVPVLLGPLPSTLQKPPSAAEQEQPPQDMGGTRIRRQRTMHTPSGCEKLTPFGCELAQPLTADENSPPDQTPKPSPANLYI